MTSFVSSIADDAAVVYDAQQIKSQQEIFIS